MTPQDEELLAELLLQWEELFERGQDTPASELASDRRDLIAELASRIEIMKTTGWMDDADDENMTDEFSDSAPSPPRRTLNGQFRLDDLIAEGGFAQVFRGHDLKLGRDVAVKMPHPSRVGSTEHFLAEARRVAKFDHSNIVPVFYADIDGETCFIVSKCIEGGSLADRIASGSIAAATAIRWITEIAGALDYAHLQGVIHRDVKPANILIDHEEKALLADFGIAQPAITTGQLAPSFGTLRYMAPEQLRDTADLRSDIYSLAVVLHEALTGKRPYSSDEPNSLRREITQAGPTIAPTIPEPIARVMAKALAKSPHARHASAAAFSRDLHTAWESHRRGVIGPAILPWIIGIGSASGIVALALMLLMRPAGNPPHGPPIGLPAPPKESPDDTKAMPAPQPNEAFALRRRGLAYGRSREFPKAIADLERAIELMPASKELPEELATIYAIRSHERFYGGDFEGSRKDMDAAIRYAPASSSNYRRRAACWFELGEYEKSLADMTDAITRDPKNADLYGLRAIALRKLGRNDEAAQDDSKSKELGR